LTVQEFDHLASDEKESIMKTLWTTLFSGLMICGVLLAQETTPSQKDGTAPPHEQNRATNSNTQGASEQPGSQQRQVPQEGGNAQSQTTSEQTSAGLRIAPGSIIPVQLTKTIDAKKVKTGDEVEAKVTQDLTTGNGEESASPAPHLLLSVYLGFRDALSWFCDSGDLFRGEKYFQRTFTDSIVGITVTN
jgi:hypothetical protein